MSTVQILTLMQVLWNHEYMDMNPDRRTFYDTEHHKLLSALPLLLYVLAPEKEQDKIWAVNAWEDYRELLRRKPRRDTKSAIAEAARAAKELELDMLRNRMAREAEWHKQKYERINQAPVVVTPVEQPKSFWDFLKGK